MRGLRAYLRFDADSFFADKILTVTEVTKWVDFDTKEPMGTKVGVFISEDNSTYPTPKDGGEISNLGQPFTVKVKKDKLDVHIGDIVVLENPVVKVYGDFSEKMSVTADDVILITSKEDK